MLITRIITAAVLLILTGLCLLYWPAPAWIIFCIVLLACAAFEWSRFAALGKLGQNLYIVLTLVLSFALLYYLPRAFAIWLYYAGAVFWGIIAPCWLKMKWRLAARPLLAALCGWLILLPAFDLLYQAQFQQSLKDNPFLPCLLLIVVIVWIADSAAYFAGRAFGKHKLAPSISPGKSWEGVAGAMMAVTLYTVIVVPAAFGVPYTYLFFWVVGVWFLTAVSIAGDLLESLFKRQIGLKDSSGLLPGHGGVLDRLDSLLALLPFAGILLVKFVPGAMY